MLEGTWPVTWEGEYKMMLYNYLLVGLGGRILDLLCQLGVSLEPSRKEFKGLWDGNRAFSFC